MRRGAVFISAEDGSAQASVTVDSAGCAASPRTKHRKGRAAAVLPPASPSPTRAYGDWDADATRMRCARSVGVREGAATKARRGREREEAQG